MSTSIRVKRICQHCNKEFTALTTVTKYCSDKCSKAAYKVRKRAEKIEQSNAETKKKKNQLISEIREKDFLSVNEVCLLIGVSRRTVYRLIERGELSVIKIGSRTVIKRSILNNVLKIQECELPEQPEQIENIQFEILDCYSTAEIRQKFGIAESTLRGMIIRNKIPRFRKGLFSYVPKIMIDKLFSDLKINAVL